MRLADMLTSFTPTPARAPSKAPYKRISTNVRTSDAQAKYERLMTEKPRTVQELARIFGFTEEGVACTIRRYRKRGLVKQVGKVESLVGGQPAKTWQWVV